uniref:Uncharacterized protein n=1 Tax=Siphoviridae sp. ct6GI21 TaxID=2825340 RepID=A0A8S5U488_9CAUD|nr:MAG TPA: hypothetical protein [Siphoviridae sp. ct6GI21]
MKEIFKQIHRYKEQDFEEGRQFEFTLNRKENNDNKRLEPCKNVSNGKMEVGKSYKITVKKYMTEPATSTFDFQDKWNNGKPMPLCIMQGEVIKETRGMYYMNLQGKAEPTSKCLVCGKTLTNPISKLYGIGPECSEKVGLIRIESEDEAKEKLKHIMEQIDDITWTGWVIKSAIKEWEEI